jgi:chromosome partitioning protein
MVILIGNSKGGTGKSTLTLLLANFLALEKKCRVAVLDMDYQQSLVQKFQRAKLLENEEAYQVIATAPEEFSLTMDMLVERGIRIILIDLPARLDDEGLTEVFTSAELVICPFSYEESCFDSTIFFSLVLKRVNPEIEITYVPNRIKKGAGELLRQEVNEQLSKFGRITAPVPERMDFQRTNTMQSPERVLGLILPVLEQLWYDHFYMPENP